MFNSMKHQRKLSTAQQVVRFERNRETPLPIYVALMIHAQTRNRKLIDIMHSHGLCIGYKRLLTTISTELANRVCNIYHNQQVVCPPQLKAGVFTTGAMDNIDHNSSARSSKDSFHGTALSLTQHPTAENPGRNRIVEEMNS